jgi:small GTP-binding protein
MARDQNAWTDRTIFLFGDPGVGKTCIVERLVNDTFMGGYVPHKLNVINARTTEPPATFTIIDGPGWKGWESGVAAKVRFYGHPIAGIVYDITDEQSFNNVRTYIKDPQNHHHNYGFVLIIIGAKSDLQHQRAVDYEDGAELAKAYGHAFIEVSSKTGGCVRDWLFQLISLNAIE